MRTQHAPTWEHQHEPSRERPATDPPSVWDQHLARVSDLVADPAWPMGSSATYKAIARGQIPVVTFAGTKYVLMDELRRTLRIDASAA